ncbi:hypothetical protein PHYBLDRAFT_63746 [Phycomyces blakesleeanus NRRL 1555(-)]|uniref:Secreted protein n=1 Tax=Phycomyces blakesleeanus (strain ATCC 8743b / DSM 1359 / FGSC 10004 / NBRC 33097 / NRRL 1555) TaxID=763407 RepID=A0A167K4F4_PHYB8|nr:hypothetical protein PHYBLDRAFT_63746 [Phycomyces blakesleeanus NRRL 1555(-)]OAD67258.1 hypothetical protein PHYBLDRAFT_63746 [Phycomyces blakesleeanus NRRL 1555(-)]|eukprot:XP_018285298.1 hypothetical protein PHYBLDRAFT_63746 [Phycomyces blakesleeanus NRRL 1555(-)]
MCLNVLLKVIRCAALLRAQMAGERMACELNFAQIFAVFQLFFAHYKNSQIMLIISLDSLPASLSLHTIICFSIYYVSEPQWNLGSFSSQAIILLPENANKTMLKTCPNLDPDFFWCDTL